MLSLQSNLLNKKMKSWKKYNPDWEYKLWDEDNIRELNINDFDVYSKKLNPGFRSDILRYIILKKFLILIAIENIKLVSNQAFN